MARCADRGSRAAPGLVTHRALDFPLGLAPFEILPLVKIGLALADGELDFDLPVLPVERKRNQSVPLHAAEFEQFADLGLVQQQLAFALGDVVVDVAVRVFVNVGVVKPDLPVLDAGKGVRKLAPAEPQSFHLGSVEHDSRLEGVEDVVIAAGLGIGQNVGHDGP